MFIENKYKGLYFRIIQRASDRDNTNSYTELHHIIPKALGGDNSLTNLVRLSAREHFICHLLLTKMVQGIYKQKMFFALAMMTAKNKNQHRTYKITARIYETIRKELSVSMKERWTDELRLQKSQSMEGNKNPFFDKHHSEETLLKLKGRQVSLETRTQMSISAKKRFKNQPGTFSGKTHSEDTRKKMSASASKPKSSKWKLSASLNRKGRAAPNIGVPHSEVTKQKIREAVSGSKNGFYGKKHSPEQRAKKKAEKLAAPKLTCYYCSKQADPMNYGRWHGENCKQRK